MNRRTRHIVVLAIAIVTATIASLGVYRVLGQAPARRANAMTPVVVAARPMVIGTQVTAQDVKVVSWPASSPVADAITDVKDAVDRGLLTGVLENEPLTGNKLAPVSSGAGLSPAIPSGMRAISVRVDDVIGVAGFIVPGSRVDVVVTIRREGDSMTRTAASNVQVLTAGTRKDQENPDAAGTSRRLGDRGETVVTLMVSPTDAERIALAQVEGQIMLMLRNPADTATTVSAGVRTDALLGSPEPAPVAPPAPKPVPRRATAAPAPAPMVAPPPAAPRTVETIRAAKRTDEVIK
jgi:pilus assembly protein CpaB